MPKIRFSTTPWLIAVIAVLPGAALAHTEVGVAGGLLSGFLHPMLGLDHLVAMVAVGLWGAQLGAPLLVALPITFPLMMALGAVLGVAGVPLQGAEIAIALSSIALGAFVVLAWRPNQTWVAVLPVAFFALFHGHAHGVELPVAANPLAYGLGFVVATGLLHLAGIGIGLLNTRAALGARVVRGCGAAVAAVGMTFLLSHLTAVA